MIHNQNTYASPSLKVLELDDSKPIDINELKEKFSQIEATLFYPAAQLPENQNHPLSSPSAATKRDIREMSVTFNPKVEVTLIKSHRNMPKEQKIEMWYSHSDEQRFRQDLSAQRGNRDRAGATI